jgi:hypothetical protein
MSLVIVQKTTSAQHFGNEMAAQHQSSFQLTSYDYLASINAYIAMSQDSTTSQAHPTTCLTPYLGIFTYPGLI